MGYVDTDQPLRKHIDCEDKKTYPVKRTGQVRWYTFINESATSKVLPSIRKYGQYKLFDNPNNNMFKTENETDLDYKVVQYIRQFYPEAIIIAGLGENQDTATKTYQFMAQRLYERPARYYDHELPLSIFWALY